MRDDLTERAAEIVRDIASVPPGERPLHLARACGDDADLRSLVESLLRVADRGASLLGTADSTLKVVESGTLPPLDPGEPAVRYEVRADIAEGGMGKILEVFDRKLRRLVAMKRVRDDRSAGNLDDALLARFLEEAQLTSQLEHPGVVPVHDFGIDDAGRRFFTMRRVRGLTLLEVFELAWAGGDEWSTTRALGVLLKVCEAVAFAHDKGVIHRDLKPANVMVGRFGEVYVMDWGLARVLGQPDPRDLRLRDEAALSSIRTDRRDLRDATPDTPLVTLDGAVIGTPAYMPPEQARGEVELLDRRADVYAVGAMLYHLLAREMPYVPFGSRLSAHTVLRFVIEGPPRTLESAAPGAPAELVAICEKAMERRPAKRYPSVNDLASDLRAFLENRTVRAHRTGAIVELWKWVQRNRLAAGALAAAVVILAAGLLASWHLYGRAAANAIAEKLQADRARASEQKAQESESRAQESARAAEAGRREARWSSYVASIRGADAAVRNDAIADARRFLDAAPEELRGFEWRYLTARVDESLMVVQPAGGSDTALLSPDGRRFATVSEYQRLGSPDDGRVRVFDSQTGAEIFAVAAKRGKIRSVAWSPDGSHLVTGEDYLTLRILDSATGEVLRTIEDHESPGTVREVGTGDPLLEKHFDVDNAVRFVSYSSDGAFVLAVGLFGAHAFDLAAGRWRPHFFGSGMITYGAAFDRDATRVVCIESEGTASVRDFASGDPIAAIGDSRDVFEEACFHHDGSRVFTASRSGTLALCSGPDFSVREILATGVGRISCARLSPNGDRVAAGLEDGTVSVYSTADHSRMALGRAHTARVTSIEFESDGRTLVTAGADGTVRRFDPDLPSAAIELTSPGSAFAAIAFDGEGRRLFSVATDGTECAFDLRDGSLLARFPARVSEISESSPTSARLAAAASGRRLFAGTASYGKNATIRDVVTGRIVGPSAVFDVFKSPAAVDRSLDRVLILDFRNLPSLARIPGGEEIGRLEQGEGITRCGAFSPDGTHVATGGDDGVVRVFASGSAAIEQRLLGLVGSLSFVAFDRSGRDVLGATATGIAVWSPPAEQPRLLVPSEARSIDCVAASPDGSRLLDATMTESILRDGATGVAIATLRPCPRPWRVGFASPFDDSGRRMVTSRVYDAASGTELLPLDRDFGDGSFAVFSPDGARIVALRADGERIHVLDPTSAVERRRRGLELRELRARAAAWVDRRLGAGESLAGIVAAVDADSRLPEAERGEVLDELTRRLGAIRTAAADWANDLEHRFVLLDRVRETVRTDVEHDPAVRAEAELIVSGWTDSWKAIEAQVVAIVSSPGDSDERYASALHAAKLLEQQEPDEVSHAVTLGAAQYRARLFAEARATLEDAIHSDPPADGDLALLFLAMSRHATGDADGAASALAAARGRSTHPTVYRRSGSSRLLDEAESIIEAR